MLIFDKQELKSALNLTAPVALGYLPLGLAFGLLFTQLGYHWAFVTLMSLCVYAGSAQFLALSLIATVSPISTIFAATLVLNLRHIFYGLPMATRFSDFSLPNKIFAIFALTDETYALTCSLGREPKDRVKSQTVSFLNYIYWVTFCTLGSWLGLKLEKIPDGLEFSLVALFAVLLTEQVLRHKSLVVIGIAVICSLFSFYLVERSQFVVGSLAMGCSLILLVRRQYGRP